MRPFVLRSVSEVIFAHFVGKLAKRRNVKLCHRLLRRLNPAIKAVKIWSVNSIPAISRENPISPRSKLSDLVDPFSRIACWSFFFSLVVRSNRLNVVFESFDIRSGLCKCFIFFLTRMICAVPLAFEIFINFVWCFNTFLALLRLFRGGLGVRVLRQSQYRVAQYRLLTARPVLIARHSQTQPWSRFACASLRRSTSDCFLPNETSATVAAPML